MEPRLELRCFYSKPHDLSTQKPKETKSGLRQVLGPSWKPLAKIRTQNSAYPAQPTDLWWTQGLGKRWGRAGQKWQHGVVSALEKYPFWRRVEVRHTPNQTEARQHRGRWTGLQVPNLETEGPWAKGKRWLSLRGQVDRPSSQPHPFPHSHFVPDDFVLVSITLMLFCIFKLWLCIYAMSPNQTVNPLGTGLLPVLGWHSPVYLPSSVLSSTVLCR